MNGIKFLKFIFLTLFLPTFCFALTTLRFSVDFVENNEVHFLSLHEPTFIRSFKVLSCNNEEALLNFRCGENLFASFYCWDYTYYDDYPLASLYSGDCFIYSSIGNGTIQFQLTGDFEPPLTEFLHYQFLPTLGQILTDIIPLFILIIGITIAFILLKGFIEFFKPFFRGK
jgi:hypothetical protein